MNVPKPPRCKHGHNTALVYCLLCYREMARKLERKKCGRCGYKRLVQWNGEEHICLACLRISK